MFSVSSEAAHAVEKLLHDAGTDLVPLVTWESDASFATGRWILGFVDRDRATRTAGVSWITTHGIEFAVDGPHHYLHLIEGATLDYTDSRFVFEAQA